MDERTAGLKERRGAGAAELLRHAHQVEHRNQRRAHRPTEARRRLGGRQRALKAPASLQLRLQRLQSVGGLGASWR